jgi:hypothetical protein
LLLIQEICPTGLFLCGIVAMSNGRTKKGGELMAKGKDRFVEVYSQGITNVAKIIVDTETGVNYLLASHDLRVGTGLTVMMDQDGKPVVTPIK